MTQFTKWAAGAFAGASLALIVAGAVAAFASSSTPLKAKAASVSIAKATLSGAGGVTGTVTFTQSKDGPLSPVQVVAVVQGLTDGLHGFHVHAVANCTPTGGPAATRHSNAGGHFDPGPFGVTALTNHPWHMGELPNLESRGGLAILVYLHTNRFTLDNGPSGVFDLDGSAVVVHAGADTYAPNAAGGNRVACGVITAG